MRALTVVLADGDVLDCVADDVRAHADGYFEIVLSGPHRSRAGAALPDAARPQISAGYFAAPVMDLIDLFIGRGRHTRRR